MPVRKNYPFWFNPHEKPIFNGHEPSQTITTYREEGRIALTDEPIDVSFFINNDDHDVSFFFEEIDDDYDYVIIKKRKTIAPNHDYAADVQRNTQRKAEHERRYAGWDALKIKWETEVEKENESFARYLLTAFKNFFS